MKNKIVVSSTVFNKYKKYYKFPQFLTNKKYYTYAIEWIKRLRNVRNVQTSCNIFCREKIFLIQTEPD